MPSLGWTADCVPGAIRRYDSGLAERSVRVASPEDHAIIRRCIHIGLKAKLERLGLHGSCLTLHPGAQDTLAAPHAPVSLQAGQPYTGGLAQMPASVSLPACQQACSLCTDGPCVKTLDEVRGMHRHAGTLVMLLDELAVNAAVAGCLCATIQSPRGELPGSHLSFVGLPMPAQAAQPVILFHGNISIASMCMQVRIVDSARTKHPAHPGMVEAHCLAPLPALQCKQTDSPSTEHTIA